MSSRGNGDGRGNNTRGFRREYDLNREERMKQAREEEAEKLRAEKKQKQIAKAERDRKWPKIETKYDPEVWKKKYREDHHKTFFESVDILKNMKVWSYEEAEKTLLDILIKITFVETNLTVNGLQNAENLFKNLQLAQNDQTTIPFTSAQDVSTFCDSMFLNFHKDGRCYRNTGVQGRRLVQELKNRLDLGNSIDMESFDEIKAAFCETIEVHENLKKFADQEAGMDYSSLWYMAKIIPGFEFDKTRQCIILNMEASGSLPLNLPIFTDTLNSSHMTKLDFSRDVCSTVTNMFTRYPERTDMMINSEQLHGVKEGFFRKSCREKALILDRSFTLTHAYVAPNNPIQQVEVFTVEPINLCFLNNLCTDSSGRSVIEGKLHPPTFSTVISSHRYADNLRMSRSKLNKELTAVRKVNQDEVIEEARDAESELRKVQFL